MKKFAKISKCEPLGFTEDNFEKKNRKIDAKVRDVISSWRLVGDFYYKIHILFLNKALVTKQELLK